MLEDPEKTKELWTDYVWADTEAEAVQKCQIKAQEATIEGKTVVRLIGKPKKVGQGKRYECTFEGENYDA
ncbi:hypothetical protein FNW02_37215 [Komarekiella sp. 'clone 1']|uniref:Uncharacterized protein n=1 Tax=Komarekiella delphini-convector SJRDD-AB1 TaxID=2593771 RepID=A0AA41BAH4_9NOST|nr:hypothetical protein [Komarekiella delphini-convector]MBD6621189.1 hypothetical protein [Komarekiella delphini-convector SJRDD-AB1]